jgi:hypothetical protein
LVLVHVEREKEAALRFTTKSRTAQPAWLFAAIAALVLGFTPSLRADASPTGVIEICKISAATNPVPTGTAFNFTVTQGGATVATATVETGAAGSNGGFGICSGPLNVPAGVVTTVTEATNDGYGVVGVTAVQRGNTGFTSLVVTQSGRSASFMLPATAVNNEVLVTFTNQTLPTGYLEICKDAASPNPASGSFSFTVSGVTGTFTVPVGGCTFPIQVRAGAVTVTELAVAGTALTGVTAFSIGPTGSQVNQLISPPSPGGLSAIVNVQAGGENLETQAHFVNASIATGTLKICKVAGSGVIVGTTFSISAEGTTYHVPAGVGGTSTTEQCVIANTFSVGSTVPVVETVPSGGAAAFSVVSTAGNTSGSCAAGSTTCTANVPIGTGITEVTFTNTVPPAATGQLKICKVAGTGIATGTAFVFTVTDGATPAHNVTVYAGSCTADGTYTVGAPLTVTELAVPNTAVTSITADVPLTSFSLANRTASFTLGTGETIVEFTNTATATLEICKIAGNRRIVGQSFDFTITGVSGFTATSLTAAAAPGNCSTPVAASVGSSVTVTEDTHRKYVSYRVNGGTPEAGNSATFNIVPGQNVVAFTNGSEHK